MGDQFEGTQAEYPWQARKLGIGILMLPHTLCVVMSLNLARYRWLSFNTSVASAITANTLCARFHWLPRDQWTMISSVREQRIALIFS